MPDVEWDIISFLRDHDDLLAQCMTNSQLIKNIRITPCYIGDNQPGRADALPYVLDNLAITEDFTGVQAAKTGAVQSGNNCFFVCLKKTLLKGHEHESESVVYEEVATGPDRFRGYDVAEPVL